MNISGLGITPRLISFAGCADLLKSASTSLNLLCADKSGKKDDISEAPADSYTKIEFSGEKSSEPSTERKDLGRIIASVEPLSRKTCDTRVDMLIKHLSEEYWCTEASLLVGERYSEGADGEHAKVAKDT